jgi:hypothetical protein
VTRTVSRVSRHRKALSPRVDGNWLELEPMLVTVAISSPYCPSYSEKLLYLQFSSITKSIPEQTARVIDVNRNAPGTARYSRNYSVPGFPRFLSVHMFGFPLSVLATVRTNGFPQKWHPRFVFRTAVPIRGSNSNATSERDVRKGFHGHIAQPIKVTQILFFKELVPNP